MTHTITRRTLLASGAAALSLPALALAEDSVSTATTHTVQMLNRHPEDRSQMHVFLPRVLAVQPGDSVLFQATDRGHNSASVKGMIPGEAAPWNGTLNQDIKIHFRVPGIYGYQCTPHASVGMVGLIVVTGEGQSANLEAAQAVRQRGRKAKRAWADIWAEAAELGLLG